MPIYEYECTKCGNISEHLVPMKFRDNTQECPECSSPTVVIISAPQIRLEGISGDFPSAYDRWEKVRKQKHAQELKQNS